MNKNPNSDWQPTAGQKELIARAEMLTTIRAFFLQKKVLEVDTPALSQGTITDVYLEAMTSHCQSLENSKQTLYLQTSPEFAMKRLLAAGSGCIYQICRAYRNDEMGRYHNPEFLMLEWYRIGFDHLTLMKEVDELIMLVLGTKTAEIITYQKLFLKILKIDPLELADNKLKQLVRKRINGLELDDRDQMLQCLFSSLIEPEVAKDRPLMVTDFPASQSSLARLSTKDPRVAERFEVYFKGIELANGFHELKDENEQRKRFEADNQQRKLLGKEEKPIDERFLAALNKGLPDCAGVALGLDRLLMLKLNKQSIEEVMAFPLSRA